MTETKTRDRSPSFPIIPLEEAFARLRDLEAKFGRHPAPASKVGIAWGVKDGGSQAAQILAALKAFDLVEYVGVAADRKAVISEAARNYLRAQQESIKTRIAQDLAVKPAQIAKYWAIWGRKRPPDIVCLDALVLENSFTDSAARTFLKVYDQTLAFAELFDADTADSANDSQLQMNRSSDVDDSASNNESRMEPVISKTNTQSEQASFQATSNQFDTASYREEKISLDEGDVLIRWPNKLSVESVEDLEHWLEGILKRAKRRAEIASLS